MIIRPDNSRVNKTGQLQKLETGRNIQKIEPASDHQEAHGTYTP
jgi:hypothetical protein